MREKEENLRKLKLGAGQIDFYSNDYLGVANLTESIFLQKVGSTGSRLISGNSKEAVDCELFLADFFEAENALVFNSGYDANLGLFSSIAQRNDTIIYDEYIHASIRDGIRLGVSKSYSFKHNSLSDLEEKLKLATGTVFVAVESLYSMDGDFCPLGEIVDLCKKYAAYIIVDEAHSGGIYGENGQGICVQLNLQDAIFARIITFGKAFGTHGAVILGSEQLKSYLVNFARSFIYTTALPPFQYELIKSNVLKLANFREERKKLFENINYFLENCTSLQSKNISPIQIIKNDQLSVLERFNCNLEEKSVAVKIIQPPTVPIGGQLIRVCLHSFNTVKEMETLLLVIKET